MKKKNKPIVIVATIIILALALFLYFRPNQMIIINYYDIYGNILNTNSGGFFSVYNVPSSAYSMDITTRISNTGSLRLSCIPTLANPTEFDSALVKNIKAVDPGKDLEWTSGKIVISQFLARSQPITFNVTINCSYPTSNGVISSSQSGSVDLNIKTACGDGLCQGTEDAMTCPQDCFFGDKVFFRTSNLTYGEKAVINDPYIAIAYNPNSCGSALTKYGFVSSIGSNQNYDGTFIMNVSGSFGAGGCKVSNGKMKLYFDQTFPNTRLVVGGLVDNYLSCGGAKFKGYIYDSTIPRGVIDLSSYSINPSMEKYCG